MTQKNKKYALVANQRTSDDEEYSYEEELEPSAPVGSKRRKSDLDQRENCTNEESAECETVGSERTDSESEEDGNKQRESTHQS